MPQHKPQAPDKSSPSFSGKVFWISFVMIALSVFLAKAHGQNENRSDDNSAVNEVIVGDVQMRTPAQAGGEPVSRAVGQVGSHVITSREVKISYVLDQVLTLQGEKLPKAQASWMLNEKTPEFQDHLAQAFLEM